MIDSLFLSSSFIDEHLVYTGINALWGLAGCVVWHIDNFKEKLLLSVRPSVRASICLSTMAWLYYVVVLSLASPIARTYEHIPR